MLTLPRYDQALLPQRRGSGCSLRVLWLASLEKCTCSLPLQTMLGYQSRVNVFKSLLLNCS